MTVSVGRNQKGHVDLFILEPTSIPEQDFHLAINLEHEVELALHFSFEPKG